MTPPPIIEVNGRYGIGEWFGKVIANESARSLQMFAEENFPSRPLCPFVQAAYPGSLCNKAGGVCSIRPHRHHTDGSVTVANARFVTTCPNRFWEDNKIFGWIGSELLGTPTPNLLKEIPFLDSTLSGASDRSVGRIDMVLMDPDDDEKWCALELQAVYFSGPAMVSHSDQYKIARNGLVYPEGIRRPDWRSSGPKRLMPQLQIKVPTLRRWGKKTAVVIDAGFRNALGKLPVANDNSNADIIWFIVDYDTTTGEMFLSEILPVTLEDSVIALTAGEPKAQTDFQAELKRRSGAALRMKPQP